MHNNKLKSLLKSFRFRLITISVLAAAIILVILYSADFRKFIPGNNSNGNQQFNEISSGNTKINYDILASRCDRDIDSVLYNFGIKKEWISTAYAKEQSPKDSKTRKRITSAQWFVKDVEIPTDLTTAEINLDLSTYVNSIGLKESVREDIRTTSITFIIDLPEDTSGINVLPLAIINVTPDNNIKRDAGNIVLIINQISKYDADELDNILNTSNEFSYIFPRNPEEIELQNKLIQMKKDVLVNLTVGANDNFDADFRIGMEDKDIKQRVKSIASDFPSIKTAILSKINKQVPNDPVFALISDEFRKNGFKIYLDTMITKLLSKDEEDSDNKIQLILNKIKEKASRSGKVISILNLSNDEFVDFYNKIQNLKKLGYKFYTLTRYEEKEEERIDREKEKREEELKKQPKETKKEVKKNVKPKQTKTSKKKKK